MAHPVITAGCTPKYLPLPTDDSDISVDTASEPSSAFAAHKVDRSTTMTGGSSAVLDQLGHHLLQWQMALPDIFVIGCSLCLNCWSLHISHNQHWIMDPCQGNSGSIIQCSLVLNGTVFTVFHTSAIPLLMAQMPAHRISLH